MALGRLVSQPERDHLYKYLILLLKWQESQRLTASRDPRWIAEHLIADSLLFLKVLPSAARTVVDIGSGAGFPGIPLKIARPDFSVTLIESRQRRASFLRAVVRELGLADTRVIDQRLETLSPGAVAGFDVATMRCAGDPRRLLAAALALIRAGGIVVASGPPADGAKGRGTSRDASTAGFERVVVPGLYGRTRQFLLARKS